ncbi:MCP methyltransferase, CheR-type, SAM-binding domain, C-terminal [Gemmatirosa kalamazoonensis]|uniref:protein-glutamate O-methyltransferase n=1 Tax=Gemmatirosa kalamazoonensis TaxID=861299 RepID=W0RK38_9BACT|nr:CheR family methyltransferase [Gemmatirosa kalamazoonensis]AHG89778.1 MCP methyltransferase, CheR-type, SAM-binding domain, C-terminal [Gemmatirosa kalamazoonensis]
MPHAPQQPPDGDSELAALVDYLYRTRGLDIGGYKRTGLLRRLTKRLRAIGATSLTAYIDYLESHPAEFARLLDTLLINVTAFFRDDLPWEYLRTEIVPRLVAQKSPADPIRVWCAGCATGEEAYTLAIVLAEAIGDDTFRDRVKIYATDLDEPALAHARIGAYDEKDVADMPPELVDKYFERRGKQVVFRKDLRRVLIFGRNDLVQDAPISRVDLLACRNTLMYFDTATQAKILARFHFALNDGGLLLLGRAETIQLHGNLFLAVDLRRRVFAKAHGAVRPRGPIPAIAPQRARTPGVETDAVLGGTFDAGPIAQLVIDKDGLVAAVNARARGLFRLGAPDLGRPLRDLEVSYRPYELRSLIDESTTAREPVTREAVPWRATGGEQRWFDILVAPIFELGGTVAAASVSFVDVTETRLARQQLDDMQAELETAYQELQSANEELETTNEELHSTVEELETTNEELQSTNEELETMNEELQSTNEELQTINDELRLRSDELNQANLFLESILRSLRAGVAVLDRDLRVMVWNDRAEDLWGVRREEADGAPFPSLDIGLPVRRILPSIRACLAGELPSYEAPIRATNRRGRAIVCQTRVLPLLSRTSEAPRGVIVLMEEPPGDDAAAADGGPSAEGASEGDAPA